VNIVLLIIPLIMFYSLYKVLKTKIYSDKRIDFTKINMTSTITILGALIFGVGVILFLTSNWSKMPSGIKVMLISSLVIIFYFEGYYFEHKNKAYPKTVKTFIILGILIFGADLFLINFIYDLKIDRDILLLLWSIGVMPFCLAFREKLVSIFYSILIIVWNITYDSKIKTFNLWYLLFFAFAIYLAYRYDSPIILIINIMGLISFYMSGIIGSKSSETAYLIVFTLAILSILLYGIGELFKFNKDKKFKYIYKSFYVILINLSFLVITFKEFNQNSILRFDSISYIVFISTVAAAICMIIKLKNREIYFKVSLILPLWIIFLQLFKLPIDIKIALNNILFPAFIIWSLIYGYLKKKNYIFVISIITFIIELVSRYFDYFFNMLPHSVFIIIGGAGLLISGILLEKQKGFLEKKKLKIAELKKV
jgi:uncharacterized membrane protein